MEDIITPTAEEQDHRGDATTSTHEDSTEAAIAADLGFNNDVTTAEEAADGESNADTELAGDIGETSLGAILSLEGEDEVAPVPETALPKDEAEEAAYALKPFIDAKEQQADKLTSENTELLDWLASEAAEKAVTDYQEGKTKMSEAEMVLREKADGFKTLYLGSREFYVENGIRFGRTPEEKEARVSAAENLLSKVVDIQLEQIMGDETLSAQEKIERIETLKFTQSDATEGLSGRNGPNVGRQEEDIKGLEDRPHMQVARLWGRVVSSIVGGYGFDAVTSLEMIASRTGQDFDELFAEVKPDLVQGVLTENLGFKDGRDNALERRGYVWSNSRKTYVKVAE